MNRPILNYHAIGSTSSATFRPWVIPRASFVRHLDLLAERGLQGVSMAEFLTDPGPNQVAITFDDAYADFVTEAVPELELRSFGATLFVPTAHVDSSAKWLDPDSEAARPICTWSQIRDLDERGIEIGSHSCTHPMLDVIDRASAEQEIFDSRQHLAEELGHDISGFCYPHGFHHRGVRQMVIDAGYTYACAVKNEMSHTNDDRHALARIVVTHDVDELRFTGLLEGRGIRLTTPGRERLQTRAFRSYRRLRCRALV